VKEFAALNGIGESTVWRMIKDGELESYKVGHQRRIRADIADAIQRPELTAAQRVRP
jgi:excisionase family DNA binding protein